MKFRYYHFALIYFAFLLIAGAIEAIVNGGTFSDEAHNNLCHATVFLGLMSYIDYKLDN